jgi:phage-related protein
VYISGTDTFKAPTRDYESISVPGRDGDLLGLEHRLENVTLSYPAFMYCDFIENMSNFENAILSKIGYQKLTDTYHPDEYRLAYYAGGLSPKVQAGNHAGEFTIQFNCKPQKYLRSGDDVITLTDTGTIYNPTLFESKPLIRVYGSGSFGIGSMTVTVEAHNHTYITVDCEMMDCYFGAVNCNNLVGFSGNDFPTLGPGINNISFDGITKLEIVPKWWRV